MKTLLKVTFFVLLMAGCSRLQLGMDAGSGMEDKDYNDDWKVLEAFKREADADDLRQSIDFLNSHTGDIEKLFEWNDDEYGFLHYAAAIGNLGLVKELVKRKVPVDIKTPKKGKTPLLIAIVEGHLEVAKYLVDKGANVYEKDANGASALHYAAMSGQLDMFQYVDSMMNKEKQYTPRKDNNGSTLLHLAALSGGLELTKDILEKYGDSMLQKENNGGYIPLHFAAAMKNRDMVELFIKYGANKTIEQDKRYSAARIAKKKGCHDIAELILDAGQN